jgi:two-component system sensor histidine kinase GlrK
LLSGFALVALPLMLAVVLAVTYVDRLSDQGERLVQQGVQVTRLSNRLTGIVIAMERNVRQYVVLGEPGLAAALAERHRSFQQAVDALSELDLDTVEEWNLDELRERGRTIAEAVAISPAAAERLLRRQPGLFSRLRQRTEAITDQGNRFVDREVARLQATSDEARRFLLLCVFAVLPVTALLVVFFTVVISRPIRQIRRAVQRLGEGDFSQPVAISAPSTELDALSDQLDWMRRRLAALEDEKNQFLRHMSHELKTPLASIREGVELLRDRSLGDLTPKQSEVADILHRSSLELLSLIENLLNFAAWQQRRSRIAYTRFEFDRLVDEVLARHRLAAENKRLRIRKPGKTINLEADRDQIRLVLDNLIANAVKFSPREGGLYIDAFEQRRDRVIEVADDGPGIPAGEREHIFNPFYQSGQPERAHVKGTGIGLSVVREAVRAHGGEVRVTKGAGRGACFRITLPKREGTHA